MPSTISQKELEDLNFSRAGAISSEDSGRSCHEHINPDVTGCVVYAHVVGDQVKKFGSTVASLRDRMAQNACTIRKIIELQDGRCTRDAKWHHAKWDKFKQQAPAVIRAGQEIAVWAIRMPTIGHCGNLEEELNRRYETIQHGWATKLR